MKKLFLALALLSVITFSLPAFTLAATSPGVKPGNFFYFFDTTFEKISLFFTFSPEKKAEKALAYADERLAEIEVLVEDQNPNAIKTAITNYESNIALAAEKSKEVQDKEKAENLFTLIADNTSKNQKVLSAVLIKVPEEAKEAITRAIEASRNGQEEATKQIAELKSEVKQLKEEVADLKKESNNQQADEVEKLKKEVEALKKQGVVQSASKQPTPATQNSQEQKKIEEKPKTITLPNGEIVEMDASGNIIRTIKETPQQTYITPVPTTQNQTSVIVQISSVNITPTITSAKIEWQTDKPTESKIFLSGGGFSSKIFNSESKLSTRHSTSIESLNGGTTYSYEIEAVGNGGIFAKESGSFSTASPVALKIFARPRYSSSNTFLEVAGANCGSADYWVSIYDQDGKEMDGVDVTIIAPFMTATEKTRQEDYTRAKIHAFFRYNTPATSTTETIIFTSGNLSTSATLHVGNGLSGHPLIQSGNYWYEPSGGSRVDPVKMMCL